MAARETGHQARRSSDNYRTRKSKLRWNRNHQKRNSRDDASAPPTRNSGELEGAFTGLAHSKARADISAFFGAKKTSGDGKNRDSRRGPTGRPRSGHSLDAEATGAEEPRHAWREPRHRIRAAGNAADLLHAHQCAASGSEKRGVPQKVDK